MSAYPTSDDIGLAIVLAAKESGEDPVAIASGKNESSFARAVALCALEICFPEYPKSDLVRHVGGPRAMLSQFRKNWRAVDRKKAYIAQWKIAGLLVDARRARGEQMLPVEGLPSDQLHLRRDVVQGAPAITSEYFRDPPPSRSALKGAGEKDEDK